MMSSYSDTVHELTPAAAKPLGLNVWLSLNTLWDRRALIVAVTIGAGVLAVLYTLTLPRQYRAEATVFLMPPTYATTLRPDVMSVEAYAKLAESEYILKVVDGELQKARPDLFGTDEDDLPTYSTKLSASREPQKPYLPLVGLRAESDSPEKARLAANAWADVVIREQGVFAGTGKANSANFILSEFPKVEKTLSEHEALLQTVQSRHAQEIARLHSELGISLRKAQLEAYEYMVVSQEEALAAARRDRDRLRPSVEQLQKELAKTPPHLTVSKAMTDDAVWAAQVQGQPKASLSDAKLQTQEVNPVHVSLSQRLAGERVDYNAIGAQIASLERQIDATRARVAAARAALMEAERRLGDAERRHAIEAAGLLRAVATSKKSFDALSEKVGEAKLAQSEPDKDLKLGAYAENPTKPVGPRRKLIVATTVAVAFLSAVGALILLTIFRTFQRSMQQPSENVTVSSEVRAR